MNDELDDFKDVANLADDWYAPGRKVLAYLQDILPGTAEWGRVWKVATVHSRNADRKTLWVAHPQHGHALVHLHQIKPYVGEAMEDDPDLDVKELAGSREYESREEWARQNLYWDEDRKMWEIPGTTYSQAYPGTVEHANHLFFVRNFPWLEEDGSELNFRVFLEPDKLDWMPLWNPFRGYVKQSIQGRVLDDDIMSEVAEQAIGRAWRETYAKEFADSLAERFGGQFKSENPQAEIETFLFGPHGLNFFNRMASEAEEFWDTDTSHKPSVNVDRVVELVTWPKLHAAMYPDRNQLQFKLGDQPAPQQQLDMFEGIEDEDDLTDLIKHDKGSHAEAILAWANENLNQNDRDGWFSVASHSDFSGGLVEQANLNYFKEHYPWLKVRALSYNGKELGFYEEDIPEIPGDSFEEFRKDYDSRENYPLLDEEGHTQLQEEKRQQAWSNWIKRSYRRGLEQKFPDMEEALYDFEDNDRFYALFDEARDRAGEEWSEDTGGDQSVSVDNVVEATDPELMRRWMYPEQDQEQMRLELESLCEGREYSCLMAPAPPELGDAVIHWGQMYVLDEELYADEPGFGRETEPHVTVKWGLHDSEPTGELLRIIEETQPFEIQIMGCSMFESSDKYDVLKFDVESEALRALNARVNELPHTDTHSEYRPHLTVAYIQKGCCRELIGKPLLDSSSPGAMRFLVKAVLFSGKGDNARKTRLFLGKPNVID